jgi:mannosyltransferase OCH1-like enzyme
MTIPKIIHKVWFDIGGGANPPAKYQPKIDKLHSLHPDWKIITWNKNEARHLISTEYPWFLKYWDGYKNEIYRIDSIRYFLLYTYGGYYIDQDVELFEPLDNIQKDYPDKKVFLIRSPHWGSKVSNFVIGSEQGHPLFLNCINGLSKSFRSFWHRKNSMIGIFTVSGPNFLNQKLDELQDKSEVQVLSPGSFFPSRAVYGDKVRGSHEFHCSWDVMNNVAVDVSLILIVILLIVIVVLGAVWVGLWVKAEKWKNK